MSIYTDVPQELSLEELQKIAEAITSITLEMKRLKKDLDTVDIPKIKALTCKLQFFNK